MLIATARVPGEGGCVYFATTAKCRQANDISDLEVRRGAIKGGEMKISPEWLAQCGEPESASLANLVIAWRESLSKRARVDLSFRYCWDAA